jgi:hypothetical protein
MLNVSRGLQMTKPVIRWYPARVAAAAIALALLVSGAAPAQTPSQDNLAALAPLLVKWNGTDEGQTGRGTVEREYARALGNRFIRVRNRSTYPPQDKNPKGETHEDEGFFSFDRTRKLIVLRQFHTEGFVNSYAQDAGASTGTISFTTEAIENIPAGFRARETYIFHGPDEFEEVFELAEPGKAFEVYSRSRFTRAK